ncbi:MAG: hypothetical protein N4A53_02445 [Pelagimonas sp.]|nr:hypothetical protein [Pelagimonas sp.]
MFGIVSAIGLMLCVFVGLPVLAVVGLYSLKFSDCIRLPNGSEIGYEAYVDLSRPYLIPEVVLREENGNVIAKEIWPIHATDAATLGTAWSDEDSSRSNFTFIWMPESGVVKETENPILYHSLLQGLGETYFGASKDMNVNTLWLFKKLKKQGRFNSNHCNTNFLTW